MLNWKGMLTAALVALACIPASQAIAAPVHVIDALNRDVVVDAPAKRIVLGFYFEEFTAVAGTSGWNRVVGLSKATWAGWRAATWKEYVKVIPRLQDLPDVGYAGDNTFSVEKVLALRPDLLILSQLEFDSLGTSKSRLDAAGIPIVVIDYNAQTLQRHLASTRAIGAVMSENTRAEELARFYQRKYDDILRRVAAARTTTKPKVYVELGYDGAGTIGNSYNGTMWGKILDNLGAENIATGRIPGGWGQMNPELVLAADPAFVFIAGSSWDNAPNAVRLGFGSDPAPARATLKTYTARPGWSNMRAVREGHVYGIDHALCRTFFDYTAMEYIAKQLYPAQFADIDPMADLRDYYARYLPVKLTGTWMLSAKP